MENVKKLVTLLKEKKLKISVAESCTGGMIASKIIEVSGASEVFSEGIVAYSEESKIKRLNVRRETIDKYGVVSYEVALEMVKGLDTEVAISTTGIAGPNGGTKETPVGTIFIGVRYMDKFLVERYCFQGRREEVRLKAMEEAIFQVIKIIR